MTFQRSCLYHPEEGLRVLEENQEDEYNRLLESGVWFDHPNKAKEFKEKDNEKSIRQQPKQRRINAKLSSKKI